MRCTYFFGPLRRTAGNAGSHGRWRKARKAGTRAASPVVRLSVGEATGRVPAPVFRRSKNTSWNRPGARPPARRAPDRTCGASGVPLAPAAWRLCRVLLCLNTVEQLLQKLLRPCVVVLSPCRGKPSQNLAFDAHRMGGVKILLPRIRSQFDYAPGRMRRSEEYLTGGSSTTQVTIKPGA